MKKFKKGLAAISGQTIALIAGLIVLATITVPAVNLLQRDQSYSVAASHANRVEKAVNKYILEQSAIVGAGSTASSPYTIDVPLLISKGYLPSGFASQNNFSSTYKTLVFQPSTQKFHSMTFLDGGTQLSMSAARKLATRIGDSGGVIENGVANGVQGLWSEKLSAFGGFNPGDGHVVIAGFFSNGSVVNEYLYRKAVPGHPELNTMSTALNMGGNDINAVRNLNATNVTATDTIKAVTTETSGETYTGGWYRTRGDTGWYSEKWGGGWHMTDSSFLRAYGGKSIYTTGIVKAATFQPDQINVINTVCPENGRISRNAEGAPLFCQKRVWTGIGGGGMSRVGVNNLDIVSNGSYKVLLVTVSTLFNAGDGSHTGSASFNVYVDGGLVGVVKTSVRVDKGGSSGHYWGYQNFGVAQKQIAVNVKSNSRVTIMLAGSAYHNSSDVRIDLTS